MTVMVTFDMFGLFCSYHLLKTHQLPLDSFLVALKMMKVEDVDIDEVQCILANLIYMVRDVNVTVIFIVFIMINLCHVSVIHT